MPKSRVPPQPEGVDGGVRVALGNGDAERVGEATVEIDTVTGRVRGIIDGTVAGTGAETVSGMPVLSVGTIVNCGAGVGTSSSV